MAIEVHTDSNNAEIDVQTQNVNSRVDIVPNTTRQSSVETHPMYGPKGETGNGIDYIAKTGTSGLNDIYTIYYTNGDTDTFEVPYGNVNIDAVANDLTNIDSVADDLTNIDSVAGNLDNINAVADNATNINAVNSNKANIDAVAGNETNINAVNSNKANIDAVATNISDINVVVDDLTNIDTVATNISDVNDIADDLTNINAVANDLTNIDNVVTNISDVNTVATNIEDVGTVADNVSAIVAVNNNSTNINAVNNNKTNIDTVASISSDITTVSNSSADITTVATNVSDVETVADNISDVGTVVSNLSDIGTVATNITDIATVANDLTNINSVANDLTNIDAVAGNEININAVNSNKTNIDTVAGSISNINSVASDLTNIDAVNSNKTNIDAVANNETNINAVNSNKTNIDTVATNMSGINSVANDLTNINAVANDLTNIDSASSYAASSKQYAVGLPTEPTEGSAKYWAEQAADSQVQSDWTESNTSSKAYILNKPTNLVTTDTQQTITSKKTFLGNKLLNFQQSSSSNKLGFTLYNSNNVEVGALEYNPSSSILTLNAPDRNSNQTLLGFRYWGTPSSTVYSNILAPKPSTTGTYNLSYGITDGTSNVLTSSNGMIDISTFLANYVSTGDLATTLQDYVLSSDLSTVATSGDYDDLINKPTIPTVGDGTITITQGGMTKGTFTTNQSGNTSIELDAGGGTSTDVQINGTSITSNDVANIVTNTAYDASSNKIATMSDVPDAQVQANWNETNSANIDYIKNKPNLATVATSGSYNDLSNKPTIPSAVTESTVRGWGFTKNTGTVTSVNHVAPVGGNVTLTMPFLATYGTTTYTEIREAYGLKKYVYLSIMEGGTYITLPLVSLTNVATFSAYVGDGVIRTCTCDYYLDTWSSSSTNVGTVTSVNNTSPDANGNVSLTIPQGTVTDVRINGTSITSNDVADIVVDQTFRKASTDAQSGTAVLNMLQTIYPVGSVYLSTNSTCPLASLFGTWTLVSSGRALWTGTGSNGGELIPAGLPNISGSPAGFRANKSVSGANYGAFTWGTVSGVSGGSGSGSYSSNATLNFSARDSNLTYGSSTTVQPPAYVVNVWRRTA